MEILNFEHQKDETWPVESWENMMDSVYLKDWNWVVWIWSMKAMHWKKVSHDILMKGLPEKEVTGMAG